MARETTIDRWNKPPLGPLLDAQSIVIQYDWINMIQGSEL